METSSKTLSLHTLVRRIPSQHWEGVEKSQLSHKAEFTTAPVEIQIGLLNTGTLINGPEATCGMLVPPAAGSSATAAGSPRAHTTWLSRMLNDSWKTVTDENETRSFTVWKEVYFLGLDSSLISVCQASAGSLMANYWTLPDSSNISAQMLKPPLGKRTA